MKAKYIVTIIGLICLFAVISVSSAKKPDLVEPKSPGIIEPDTPAREEVLIIYTETPTPIPATATPDSPPADPTCMAKTIGYWHRQCMGYLNELSSSKKGPPLHPDFTFEQLDAMFADVDDILASLGIDETTCEGMEADPANDPCQRAIKQFTAFLLNIHPDSLNLGTTCCVDFGDGAIVVGTDAYDLITSYLIDMNPDGCKIAADLAEAINSQFVIVDCDI